MTPYALTAEQLLALLTPYMDINRPIAAVPWSKLAAGELEMATQDVDLDLKDAVRAMLDAARSLDNCVLRAEEGADVSLEISTSEWLRSRADRFMPPRPAWPAGPGMAKVIDLATWRKRG
jgi:hypothetical protein